MPATLQIFFEKNLIQVSQVKVSQDGEFTDTFTAAGPQWKNEGTVTIKADYGGESTELNIEFFKIFLFNQRIQELLYSNFVKLLNYIQMMTSQTILLL